MQDRNNMQEGLLTPSTLGRGWVLCVVWSRVFEKVVALWVSRKLPAALPVSEFLCVCVCVFSVLVVVVVEWSCQETAISFLLINSVPGGCSLAGLASCFLRLLWMAPSEPPACPWPGHDAAR